MESPAVPAATILQTPKASFWRRLGGGSLTISIIVHAVLLVLALFWILQIIPPEKEKTVDFKPSGGGGGGSPKMQANKSQNRVMKQATQRVAAIGTSSSFALPEPDASTAMTALGSLGAASGGLGGGGSGGGRGEGIGRGIGDGMGDGIGMGPAGKLNPFGALSSTPNALIGTFYDLKQTDKKKPTNISNEQTQEVIREFVNRGWKETFLSRDYFQAPQKLYQTKIYIPLMQAEGAPAAFNCEKDVQPSRWIIVYRGIVTPPTSGRYRFVGAGDDVLVVRFNNKHVFDHGFYGGTTGTHLSQMKDVLTGANDDRERQRQLRDSPMKLPVEFYKYDTTNNWNGAIGGLAVGPTFEAKAGTAYPIEILLSEIPGGLFCASLMIEKIGEKYEKASTGSPILPVFRIDHQPPAVTTGDNAPPFQKDAPSWKVMEGMGKIGI
ncbi:MAG: hypothetical protein KF712_02270 [Akkermansiaceae bacterium]|nr:hypothetical protein [Akkermansiaceae bacterium]